MEKSQSKKFEMEKIFEQLAPTFKNLILEMKDEIYNIRSLSHFDQKNEKRSWYDKMRLVWFSYFEMKKDEEEIFSFDVFSHVLSLLQSRYRDGR